MNPSDEEEEEGEVTSLNERVDFTLRSFMVEYNAIKSAPYFPDYSPTYGSQGVFKLKSPLDGPIVDLLKAGLNEPSESTIIIPFLMIMCIIGHQIFGEEDQNYKNYFLTFLEDLREFDTKGTLPNTNRQLITNSLKLFKFHDTSNIVVVDPRNEFILQTQIDIRSLNIYEYMYWSSFLFEDIEIGFWSQSLFNKFSEVIYNNNKDQIYFLLLGCRLLRLLKNNDPSLKRNTLYYTMVQANPFQLNSLDGILMPNYVYTDKICTMFNISCDYDIDTISLYIILLIKLHSNQTSNSDKQRIRIHLKMKRIPKIAALQGLMMVLFTDPYKEWRKVFRMNFLLGLDFLLGALINFEIFKVPFIVKSIDSKGFTYLFSDTFKPKKFKKRNMKVSQQIKIIAGRSTNLSFNDTMAFLVSFITHQIIQSSNIEDVKRLIAVVKKIYNMGSVKRGRTPIVDLATKLIFHWVIFVFNKDLKGQVYFSLKDQDRTVLQKREIREIRTKIIVEFKEYMSEQFKQVSLNYKLYEDKIEFLLREGRKMDAAHNKEKFDMSNYYKSLVANERELTARVEALDDDKLKLGLKLKAKEQKIKEQNREFKRRETEILSSYIATSPSPLKSTYYKIPFINPPIIRKRGKPLPRTNLKAFRIDVLVNKLETAYNEGYYSQIEQAQTSNVKHTIFLPSNKVLNIYPITKSLKMQSSHLYTVANAIYAIYERHLLSQNFNHFTLWEILLIFESDVPLLEINFSENKEPPTLQKIKTLGEIYIHRGKELPSSFFLDINYVINTTFPDIYLGIYTSKQSVSIISLNALFQIMHENLQLLKYNPTFEGYKLIERYKTLKLKNLCDYLKLPKFKFVLATQELYETETQPSKFLFSYVRHAYRKHKVAFLYITSIKHRIKITNMTLFKYKLFVWVNNLKTLNVLWNQIMYLPRRSSMNPVKRDFYLTLANCLLKGDFTKYNSLMKYFVPNIFMKIQYKNSTDRYILENHTKGILIKSITLNQIEQYKVFLAYKNYAGQILAYCYNLGWADLESILLLTRITFLITKKLNNESDMNDYDIQTMTKYIINNFSILLKELKHIESSLVTFIDQVKRENPNFGFSFSKFKTQIKNKPNYITEISALSEVDEKNVFGIFYYDKKFNVYYNNPLMKQKHLFDQHIKKLFMGKILIDTQELFNFTNKNFKKGVIWGLNWIQFKTTNFPLNTLSKFFILLSKENANIAELNPKTQKQRLEKIKVFYKVLQSTYLLQYKPIGLNAHIYQTYKRAKRTPTTNYFDTRKKKTFIGIIKKMMKPLIGIQKVITIDELLMN